MYSFKLSRSITQGGYFLLATKTGVDGWITFAMVDNDMKLTHISLKFMQQIVRDWDKRYHSLFIGGHYSELTEYIKGTQKGRL